MMKLRRRLYLSALFLFIITGLSCKIDHGNTKTGGFINPSLDSCRMEPDHQYYISLPDPLDSEQKVPLVIVIDPHGDGFSAMQKFKDALKDLPIVIAGSQKLRNNYAGFEFSLENLNNDLVAKYPVDPQKVIVAGFSGGARMAFYYGIKNPVQGIIMFGAGPGQPMGGVQKKKIYAVSGTRDFNFIEQYRPLFTDIQNRSHYINDYFRGTHSWPPERYIREAVVFCLREGPESFQTLSSKLSDDFLQESDSLHGVNDLFFAGKALEKAWHFAEGNSQQQLLSRKIDAFKSNSDWMAYQQKIESLLKSEDRMKLLYAENLTDPDTAWWSQELNTLSTQINVCSDPIEEDYYYRLKGFLGIYLYSQINRLLQKMNSGDLIDQLIWIYEQVEPDSKDLVHFKAELSQIRGSGNRH